jgi:biotin transport system substrate-specific component
MYTSTISAPVLQEKSWIKEAMAVLGASLVIALFAPVAIPLPFTPVPISLQPHVVLFFGALLGSRRGMLAVIAYLLQGAAGLPVFACGLGGLPILLGPTGGYLLGYAAAAYFTGLIIEKRGELRISSLLGAFAMGNGVIYLCGAIWLSRFVGLEKAILMGVVPFIAGDFLKSLLALKGLRSLRALHSFFSRP